MSPIDEPNIPSAAPADAATVPAAASAALAAWQTTHPQATLAAIETAVEAHLAPLRAQLIRDTLPPDPAPPTTEQRPVCPHGAVDRGPRGQPPRTLLVPGQAPVTLTRTYWTCPRGGDGLFPPG